MRSDILVLLGAFLDLAVGRRRPQDIPASHLLFVLVYAGYLVATVLLAAVAESWETAIRAAAVDGAVLPAFVIFVLRLRRLSARWLQTLTALAGTGAIFTAAAILPFIIIGRMQGSPLSALASFAALVLFLWNVLVAGHILRHAMSVSYPAAMIAALAYVVVSTAAIGYLVPEVMS